MNTKTRNIEFEDEMRVGTRTDLGRRWMPVGVRPTGKQKIGYRYLYLYVSLKPLREAKCLLVFYRVWIRFASTYLFGNEVGTCRKRL